MLSAKQNDKKLLAVLIDPEKIIIQNIPSFFEKVHQSIITHVFVGGSTDVNNQTEHVVETIKKETKLPVLLFPGSVDQITAKADGILFLSLLSGRNPEYLIDQHIKAVPFLQETQLEIIPTGYILIDGGKHTATQKVSNTSPIAQEDEKLIVQTAVAGEYLGKKLIYLEAGSGATVPVNSSIVDNVKKSLKVPVLVGGGIRTKKQLDEAYRSGADLVVIGTAFEENESFFNDLKSTK
jgi:putative glycerol-1-phosphate prenyltransferase